MRLHLVTCSVPIYIPGEFQSIWRPPSSGPNYLGFQSSSGAHHSMEEFKSIGFESGFGDLDTWVILTVARSISWHISWGDWTLLASGPNYWGLQHSSRAWHFPAWRLSISTARIYLIQSSLYIQPLEAYFVLSGAFCSSSYLLLVWPSEVYARSAIYCIDLTLLIIKRSDLCLCFYILNILWSPCVNESCMHLITQ